MPSLFGAGIGRSLKLDTNQFAERCSKHATLRLRQRKKPEHKVSETVAHNSVFASKSPDAFGSGRINSNPLQTHPWGHSSVGRAVALQAIGLGFESPCLHQAQRGRAAKIKGRVAQ